MNFEIIKSAQNIRIKYLRKLQQQKQFRNKENLIVLEGYNLLEEALKSCPENIESLYVSEKNLDNPLIKDLDKNIKTVCVEDTLISRLAWGQNAHGIILLIKKFENKLDIKKIKSGFALEGIQDPGNMGTIIRTAASFDLDGVFVDHSSCDPFSIAAMGSGRGGHFRVGVYYLKDYLAVLKSFEGTLYATSLDGNPLPNEKLDPKSIFCFGNEGKGLSETMLSLCQKSVSIPMKNHMDSLNVGVAAGICGYEYARQR